MKSYFYTLGDDTLIIQKYESSRFGSPSETERYSWKINGWGLNSINSRWAEPRGNKTFVSFTAALLAGIHFLNYLRAYDPVKSLSEEEREAAHNHVLDRWEEEYKKLDADGCPEANEVAWERANREVF